MQSHDLSAFQTVCSNLDILSYLFSFLDFGHQLRLANTSPQLMFVYRHFIWHEINNKKVKIKKFCETVRLKTNNNRKKFDLLQEEYIYFLNIFGDQVEKLSESHGNALDISPQLCNLTSIKYSYLLITKQQIQLMAEICSKLETLVINGCCNKKHEILRLGTDIELHALLAMTRLKSFSLKTGLKIKMKYGFAENLTKKTKLPADSKSLMESLNIYLPTLASRFLSLFPQLKTLTITVFYAVTNEEIIAFATACPQLKELSFHLTSFENIKSFSCLKSLSDLSFYNCEGLNYENLKEILTVLNLITFTSTGTKYDGLFHYYFLAPTIKSVYIDAIKPFDFKTEQEFYRCERELQHDEV